MDIEPADLNLNSEPLFAERAMPGGFRTALAGCIVGGAVLVAGLLLDQGIAVAVGATILLFTLIFLSAELYSSVSLTRQRLKVGRKSIDVATINRTFGLKKGEDFLDEDTLVWLSGVGDGWGRKKRDDISILGGAVAKPANGSGWVILEQVDGTRYAVAVRNREEFMDGLHLALGTQ